MISIILIKISYLKLVIIRNLCGKEMVWSGSIFHMEIDDG